MVHKCVINPTVIMVLVIFLLIGVVNIPYPYGGFLLKVELLLILTGGVLGVLWYLLKVEVPEARRKFGIAWCQLYALNTL